MVGSRDVNIDAAISYMRTGEYGSFKNTEERLNVLLD